MRFGDIDIGWKGVTILNKEARKIENLKTTIVERQLQRVNADIGKWRNAIRSAESVQVPNRTELMRVYQEVILDNHLSSLISSRLNKMLAHKFILVDDNGDEDEDATKILQKSWFIKWLTFSFESKLYGYSFMQFNDLEDFVFKTVCLIPREYIEPSMKVIKTEPFALSGVRFDEEPINNWTFFVGDEDLGILNKIAPVAVWKKNALGAWAEFIELFGIPPRIGRTNVRDEKLRSNMVDMLSNMGRMAWGVFDKDDEIELVETKGTGDPYKVFDMLVERANSEMSKNITGGTMTADDGSSRSQSEVHERGFDTIVRSDLRWIEALFNEEFGPWLIENHDFPFEGLTLKADMTERLDLTDQMDITKVLLEHYEIPEDWINDRFGIPVVKKTEEVNPSNFFFESLRSEISAQYKSFKMEHSDDHILSDSAEEALYRDIFSGVVTINSLPTNLYDATHTRVNDHVIEGFGGDVDDFPTGSEKRKMIRDLKNNVFRFSGGKTFHNVREMQSHLKDADGNFRPFKEFRNEAKKVFDEFNVHHLQAELNTARSQAESAENWLNFQDQKDVFPLLTYRTQQDGRVRNEHQALEGITAHIDSTFWANNFTPNGYNCRCFEEQQTSSVRETPLNKLNDVMMREFEEVDPVFRMNSGKDRVVFSMKHPYFLAPKGFKEKRDDNFGLPIP